MPRWSPLLVVLLAACVADAPPSGAPVRAAAAAADQPPEVAAPSGPAPQPPATPGELLGLDAGLRAALARYRELAGHLEPPALPDEGPSLKPGALYAGAADLSRYLIALGDMAADDTASEPVYAGALVEGVKGFQRRHGLEPDGVIGRQTRAALAVPLGARVRQIQATLARIDELPIGEGPVLLVNVPMFHAWGWARLPGEPDFDSAVIVGRAVRTETPMFAADMTYVVFRPYWNVPRSILRNEILPRLKRDPDYLVRERLEIVAGESDNAAVVAVTDDALAALARGVYRLRQRPGSHNALGLVKFMFPNEHSVYLHGTPAPGLFARARRDLSHGCVRVQVPDGLAEWVLAPQPEWTSERIRAAMREGPDSRAVTLARPVRVVMTYLTAMVWPGEETVRFADDIYGRDGLDEAARLSPAPTRLPAAETACVDVDEVRAGIVADAAQPR